MALDTHFLLDVLALLGGGRGHALNDLTPHLLGMLAWGALCIYLLRVRQTAYTRSHDLLLVAFVFSCLHEAADFVANAAAAINPGESFFQGSFWPPFELLLCAVSRILLAAAFIHLLQRQRKFTLNFLQASLPIIAIIYGYTAIQWQQSFQLDQTAQLDSQYCSWAMNATMTVLIMIGLIKCIRAAPPIRWSIIIALLMLMFESVLGITAYLGDASLPSVLNPIRGCLALAAIALFGYATLMFQLLTENRIKQSTQNSERLESLGLLSSGIAHDFNNHLQIILGYVELAKVQSKNSSESQQSLQRIEEAADRAGALVNQLLSFSTGQTPRFENVDLNETITKLTPLLSRLLGSEVKLVHDLDLNAKGIKADIRMIEQIILNLVANAKDAIAGHGTITLRSRAVVSSNESGEHFDNRTQLVVADTGQGMDEKTINRMFEPFFTTKPLGKGTGLGLATVYSALQKHNGKIRVVSEPSAYTRVYVDFPASEVNSPTPPLSTHSNSITVTGRTILLAEDEIAIRELASTLLESAGYTVIVASNGQHAINIINTFRGPIDLCLFDVAMPILNGYQTYDRIRETRPEIAVLFITGNTARVEQLRAEYPHLQKPFTKKSLLDALSHALEHKEASSNMVATKGEPA